MPPKRKSDAESHVETSSKKQRTTLSLTEEQLQALSKEELIKTVLNLQQDLTKTRALAESSGNRGAQVQDAKWTAEKIQERAVRLQNICHKEIKKQMKWQPSCKHGKTKWSYVSVVPNVEVFNKIFGVPEGRKVWKQKKLSMAEFMEISGFVRVSCRYNDLTITGENVSVKWDPEKLTFKLSGTYGI